MAQGGIVFTQGAEGYIILRSQQAQTKIVFFDSDGSKYTSYDREADRRPLLAFRKNRV